MLTQYTNELRKKVHSGQATAEDRELFAYAQAYRKGEEGLKAFRRRLISKEINAKYDSNAQIAILFNAESEPHEYATYQAFRIECKARADATMERFRAMLEEAINGGVTDENSDL